MTKNEPEIVLSNGVLLRRFRDDDAAPLVPHANNRNIARNLRTRFPHPYRIEDARFFVEQIASAPETDIFAIVVNGEAIGAAGLDRQGDVHFRTIELGYWLAESYWGRGIATSVVSALASRAFEEYEDVIRLQARVYGGNTASMRVLEKNGFVRESVRRLAVTRFDETRDEYEFVLFRDSHRRQ